MHKIHTPYSNLYDIGLGTNGEFHSRVCDSFKIEYINQDITFEDITESFMND